MGTSCRLIDKTANDELPTSEAKEEPVQSDQSQESMPQRPKLGKPIPDCCENKECLLVDTPRVGEFHLDPKPLEESVIGKGESGQTFKFGRARVTQGSVKAARTLLAREFPQVTTIFLNQSQFDAFKKICFPDRAKSFL